MAVGRFFIELKVCKVNKTVKSQTTTENTEKHKKYDNKNRELSIKSKLKITVFILFTRLSKVYKVKKIIKHSLVIGHRLSVVSHRKILKPGEDGSNEEMSSRHFIFLTVGHPQPQLCPHQ